MIFVTVGTSVPFDRLVDAMDKWAASRPEEKIFAQVGSAKKFPANINSVDFVTPARANALFSEASLIVSHAGMGSILSALRYRKPILILPRRAALGETRNDHQVATAKWLDGKPGVTVAYSEGQLISMLESRHAFSCGSAISEHAQVRLIARLQEFIMAD